MQRIRPFVHAKNPGDANDTETKAFEARIRTEAEDLKLESFGIEVRWFTTGDGDRSDTPALAHHLQRVHYESGQLRKVEEVLRRWIPGQAEGEGWHGQGGLGPAWICVSDGHVG